MNIIFNFLLVFSTTALSMGSAQAFFMRWTDDYKESCSAANASLDLLKSDLQSLENHAGHNFTPILAKIPFRKIDRKQLPIYIDLVNAYKKSKNILNKASNLQSDYIKFQRYYRLHETSPEIAGKIQRYLVALQGLININYQLEAISGNKKFDCAGFEIQNRGRNNFYKNLNQCRKNSAGLEKNTLASLRGIKSKLLEQYKLFHQPIITESVAKVVQERIKQSPFKENFVCSEETAGKEFHCTKVSFGNPSMDPYKMQKIFKDSAFHSVTYLGDIIKRHQLVMQNIDEYFSSVPQSVSVQELRNQIFFNDDIMRDYVAFTDFKKTVNDDLSRENFKCRLKNDYQANIDNKKYTTYTKNAVLEGLLVFNPYGWLIKTGRLAKKSAQLLLGMEFSVKMLVDSGKLLQAARATRFNLLATQATLIGLNTYELESELQRCEQLQKQSYSLIGIPDDANVELHQCQEVMKNITLSYTVAIGGGLFVTFDALRSGRNVIKTLNATHSELVSIAKVGSTSALPAYKKAVQKYLDRHKDVAVSGTDREKLNILEILKIVKSNLRDKKNQFGDDNMNLSYTPAHRLQVKVSESSARVSPEIFRIATNSKNSTVQLRAIELLEKGVDQKLLSEVIKHPTLSTAAKNKARSILQGN